MLGGEDAWKNVQKTDGETSRSSVLQLYSESFTAPLI